MSADWPNVRLSELIDIKHGWAFKGTHIVEDLDQGPIVVAIGNFDYSGGFRFESTRLKRYTGEYPKDYKLKAGEILLAMTCQTAGGEILGIPGRIPEDENLYLHNQRLGKVVIKDRSAVDDEFLYWLFLSKRFNHHLFTTATGTKILHTSPDKITSYKFNLPSLEEQKVIGQVLNSFSRKIATNRQINQTLEEIAQAIFKSWFVDFDPVKAKIEAKANGRDPERAAMCVISGKTDAELDHLPPDQLSQLSTTAALFPDELTDSEIGPIPKGWRGSTIGKEFKATMGQSPPGHTYNEAGEGMPFFQGRRDFGWRYPTNRVYCTEPKRYAKIGDTLLSVRAPVGDVNKATADCCIGRGIASLRHKSGCEAYTYYTMKRLGQYFSNFDTEGTVFGSINQKDLKAIKIISPNSEILKIFSKIAGSFDHQILNHEKQINTLTQLRDTLLPKLLSGEIDLSQVP